MINHARTLLLNISAQRTQLQDPGYEYVPTEFIPIQLPPALVTLRRVLFGARPDLYFMSARAQELLGYIHNTELESHIYSFDPRVTYWPPMNAAVFGNAKANVFVRQTGGAPMQLVATGQFSANSTTGRSTEDYTVVMHNTDGITFAVTRADGETETTSVSSTVNPPTLPLPGTALGLQPNFNSAVSEVIRTFETTSILVTERFDTLAVPRPESLPVGANIARWLVTARANPQPVVTALLPNLELLGEPLFLSLFGVAPVEPYLTFKNLWFDHPIPAYRLAGLTLAMIYRTEEAKEANRG
jgi:hypothetical protein